MTNIGIICAFPVQSAPFREKISTTIGTSHLFNVCVSLMSKESEGENSYLNRAANGCYRLKFFRDVKNITCLFTMQITPLTEDWQKVFSEVTINLTAFV